jgi:hypothetical protein
MTHILFLNEWEGLGFMLKRKLDREKVETEWFNAKDNPKEFKKYNIKTTPVLIILDKKEEADRLTSTDEIVEYLKNVSNTEIPT